MKSILFVLFGSSLLNIFLFSDIVIGQGITGIVTIIVAYIAYRTNVKINKLDVKVDGRLTQLLEATRSDQRQQGNTEGQDKVRAENIALSSDLDKQTETIMTAIKDAAQPSTPIAPAPVEPTKVIVVEPAEVIVVNKTDK